MIATDSLPSTPLLARLTAGLLLALVLAAICLWSSPAAAETLLRGTLVARYYYIYALDYDRGGEWSGQAFMCSRDKEFTIRGNENCLARGYDRTGFFEVDTGEQRAWTVQLTEANEQPSQKVPGMPGGVAPGNPGVMPGLPNPPSATPRGTSGLPPAAAPGSTK